MEHRLEQFMRAENLTSAKCAEILSVQPSSISHLLSGRNKPNFDFISKLLLMFPQLNPRWIINGEGAMYLGETTTESTHQTTEVKDVTELDFNGNSDANNTENKIVTEITNITQNNKSSYELPEKGELNQPTPNSSLETEQVKTQYKELDYCQSGNNTPSSSVAKRVLIVYDDNTFELFLSRK